MTGTGGGHGMWWERRVLGGGKGEGRGLGESRGGGEC